MRRTTELPTPASMMTVLLSSMAVGAVATMGAVAAAWPGAASGQGPVAVALSLAIPALVGATVAALPGILLFSREAALHGTTRASLLGLLVQAEPSERSSASVVEAMTPRGGQLTRLPLGSQDARPTDAAVAAIDAQRRWADTAIAESRQVRLATLPAPALVTASAVPIGRVLDILIGAALKHGHGDVEIRLDSLGDRTRIRVADHPTSDEMPCAVDGPREPRLALAQRITEALGGELTSGHGRLTSFEVLLPKAVQAA